MSREIAYKPFFKLYNLWKEQLVDPLIHYFVQLQTSVIVPLSPVLNRLVNPEGVPFKLSKIPFLDSIEI